MRIAVLTLTRDRLDYTTHCFTTLYKLAGCDYEHFVLDQGSTDGTAGWLRGYDFIGRHHVTFLNENIGIHAGMNRLLDQLDDSYDAIVKFDNDCELTQRNTLRDTARLAVLGDSLLSPQIHGLRNPPAPIGTYHIAGETILQVNQIGGIFLAAPAWVYRDFRYDESLPVWGGDDGLICGWFRQRGGRVGYVQRLNANHYETTDGQWERYPDYFARKTAEGLPA